LSLFCGVVNNGLERIEFKVPDWVGVGGESNIGDKGSLEGGVVEEEEVWLEDLLVLRAPVLADLVAEDRVLLEREDEVGLGSGTVFR
jgi:hypothetical protein